jgi:amino acid transporter
VGWKHYAISLLLIALITYVNVRGIQLVGKLATFLELMVLLPIVVMCGVALGKWQHNPFVPLVPPNKPLFQVFGVGLALGLWLYSGYEQLSTVAEEVEDPQRTYPRALAWVVPLSIATYFLPTFCALGALGNWQQWHTGYFSDAAELIGGRWLGLWMTVSATIASVSLLNSTVLASTRMPYAMAEDGYISHWLTRQHARYRTPAAAIVISCAIYAVFAWHSLTQLISVYVWLRIATSLLTVLSAWKLRQKEPDLPRAFRIPWGHKGLMYAVLAPIVMSGVALLGSDSFGLRWGPVALLLGPLAYLFFRRRKA